MLSKEQINEIEARANAATEGPWGMGVSSQCPSRHGLSFMRVILKSGVSRVGQVGPRDVSTAFVVLTKNGEANSNFIAHARTDIPALIETIRAQAAEIERLEARAERAEQKWARATKACKELSMMLRQAHAMLGMTHAIAKSLQQRLERANRIMSHDALVVTSKSAKIERLEARIAELEVNHE